MEKDPADRSKLYKNKGKDKQVGRGLNFMCVDIVVIKQAKTQRDNKHSTFST